jgi:hypothetical protein
MDILSIVIVLRFIILSLITCQWKTYRRGGAQQEFAANCAVRIPVPYDSSDII